MTGHKDDKFRGHQLGRKGCLGDEDYLFQLIKACCGFGHIHDSIGGIVANLGSADTFNDGGVKGAGDITNSILEKLEDLALHVTGGIFIGGCAPPNTTK
jgi:hypothetical protein